MSETKIKILQKETIIVGSNLIRDFLPKDLVAATPKVSKYVVITDTSVHRLHFGHLLQSLLAAGITSDRIYPYTVPVGEQTKSREQKASIEDWLLGNECNRDTCIIALGGGVVGDLSGFVAATYLRGIPFIQIPTTLLAMVDSSIGGKTGINTAKAKNLIGAFYQPVRVYIDLTFLRTLPKRQIANGMAEVIKSFAIRNEEMFSLLEESYDKVFDPAANEDVLHKIIYECVKIKADIVTEDETEGGVRSLLNFGHTVGHAIESVCMDFMLHGECVAIGMVKEAEISRTLGHLAPSAVARLASCIRAYGLPLAIPAEGEHTNTLMDKMALDKKNVKGKKRCVLLTKIGACLNDVAQPVDDDLLIRSVSKPIVVIPPSTPIQGSLRVPGSKSISNRVLLLAAMGEGECRVGGLLHSDDTQVMMNALKLLGAAEFRYEKSDNPHDTEPVLVVKGNGGKMTAPPAGKHLYLGNAGTATRFLATLCTLVGVYGASSTGLQKVVLTGDKRMCERPIKDLVIALKQHQDCEIRYLGTDGCPPLEIDGTGLRGGKIELAADVSSQFVSSILLSAPYANTPVTLNLDPHKEVVSQPYIDMTVSLMRDFGVDVQVSADKRTYVIPKRPYKNPSHFEVESDASSSTYPLVMAAITGGKVTALNVTSKSLQGDAQFCKVLEKMGCTVSQDEQKTTVEGPKDGKLRGCDYNMGDLTDAFMGVACLAAVAEGTTRITGIANQRVKECNRIQVMVEELSKLGVTCKELDDGVEVEGLALSSFQPGSINCYNDHRIAMSFACLGCRVPNITIKDKECVQKTYPEFWDDLSNVFGVKLTAPSAEPAAAAPRDNGNIKGKPQQIIIIGMRGAGKTSQGRVAAAALGYPFIDLDEAFEAKANNIKTFIETHGWEKFREQELAVLQATLKEYEGRAVVVSCGGGIVETEPARQVLLSLTKRKDTSIIFFQRHIDDIVHYLLEKDKVRPAFTEHPSKVYERRHEHYKNFSTHEFVVMKGDEDWQAIETEFIDFVRQITGNSVNKFVPASASNVEHDLGSFFLSLTFPDYTAVPKKTIEAVSVGAHGLELRADLIAVKENGTLDNELLAAQVAALRRSNTHRLPIIFTIRTKEQGGGFNGDEKTLFDLLAQGARYGAEYIDMESCWSKQSLEKIAALKESTPGSFKIISSFHCYDPKIWDADEKIIALFDKCYFSKVVDVVKVVLGATEAQTQGVRLHQLADQWRAAHPGVLTIVLCTGEKGRIARVLNRYFTPATHPLLTTVAAPGQTSIKDIHLARTGLGFIPKKNFYLFGTPISQSRSPLIHNTGFKILGLPHEYHLFETMSIDEIAKKIRDPATHGASVTIPHKLDVIPLVDKLSDHARKIGAVNTIYKVPTADGKWQVCGDNTDFLGVKGLLTARLSKEKPLHALVLGAGGTSRAVLYALNRMNAEGYKITKHLYNRTADKAQALAAEFDSKVVVSLLDSPSIFPDLVISTLPPQAQTEIFEGDAKRFSWIFEKCSLAMDLVYRPRETPVLKLAKENNVKYLIEGIEILLEQGYAQFCIWTGTKAAPTNEIREAVMASL